MTSVGRGLVALLLLVLGCVAFGVVAAAPAHACSCADSTAAEAVAGSAAVFEGRVRDVDPGDVRQDIDVEVSRVWKGRVEDRVTVSSASEDSACGVSVASGSTRMWFAEGDGDEFGTSSCAGTATPDRLDALVGDAAAPVAGDGTPSLWPGVLAGLALGIGVAAYVVLGRRRA